MSENNNPTPEELVKTVHFTVQRATPTVRFRVNRSTLIPIPIDPTLSHQGEAADAKATGDAIAAVADSMRVNERAAVQEGNLKKFTVYAGDIPMSDAEGAQNVRQAIESVADRNASEIMYDPEGLVSVKAEIDSIKETIDGELSEEEIDEIFDEVFAEEEE